MSEEWRPVAGWEGFYSVSDAGQVRSEARLNSVGRRVPEKLLKPTLIDGYESVVFSREGVRHNYRVHRLVLLVFIGSPPEGMKGLHYDDDRSNNHISNLRWGTSSENTQDSIRNGTFWSLKITHCVWGHELTVDNLVPGRLAAGVRVCLICNRRRVREGMRNARIRSKHTRT